MKHESAIPEGSKQPDKLADPSNLALASLLQHLFAEGDQHRSLGFLYPRSHGRATSPAHFTGVLPPQAARHRAVPFAPCWPFPRPVRPLPWTANRRTTLRVVNLPNTIDSESRPTIRHRPLPSRAPGAFSLKAIVTVAWGFSTPGPMAAPHPPHISPVFCRRPRRVFAEGDCYRSLGFLYPRSHGRATSPAHFTGVLPPQAAKHRAVPFAQVGRFPDYVGEPNGAPIREYGRGVPVPGVMTPGYFGENQHADDAFGPPREPHYGNLPSPCVQERLCIIPKRLTAL